MNSFRHVERALQFEINRQMQMIGAGEHVVRETLLWDENRNVAHPMRSKEESDDYRYFPDPDLVPVVIDEPWIERVRSMLPEHPTNRRDRFISEYGLPMYDADVLTSEKGYADYFENILCELRAQNKEQVKQASNWVMTEVLGIIGERKIDIKDFPISPGRLAAILCLINDRTISGKIAKEVFEEMLISPDDPQAIVERKNLAQLSDESEIEKMIDEVLQKNQPQGEKYRAGNEKILGFFVGEVMRLSRGRANPGLLVSILKKKLSRSVAST